jgi:hypothetical protein
MQQWREPFLSDVRGEEEFYARHRTERRADRRCRRAFTEDEIDNPNSRLNDKDPRWDDLWTATTSDDK